MEWDYVRPWMWNQKSMRTWQGSSFASAVSLLTVRKATARTASQLQFVWPHQGVIIVACINNSRIFPIIRQFGVWRRCTSCLCKLRLRFVVLQSSERGSNSFRRWRGTTALYKNLDHRIFQRSSLLLTLDPWTVERTRGFLSMEDSSLKVSRTPGSSETTIWWILEEAQLNLWLLCRKKGIFIRLCQSSSTYDRLDMNAVINKDVSLLLIRISLGIILLLHFSAF